MAIERATNGLVTRRDLRPDDWKAIWPELAEPAASSVYSN
jgi:DNA-binding transcriptional regulator YdaS (Cro superfamily)